MLVAVGLKLLVNAALGYIGAIFGNPGLALGIFDSQVEDVVLATWEACANAIEHAVDPTEHLVLVRAWLADSRVHVTVSDTGQWAPPSERDDRGLGLRLMASLVSSMEIDEHENGTTVRLEKALSASAD